MKRRTIRTNENTLKAIFARRAAVKDWACPKCGAPQGFDCKSVNGGSYRARVHVHSARLQAVRAQQTGARLRRDLGA